jgi:hypothetical protein
MKKKKEDTQMKTNILAKLVCLLILVLLSVSAAGCGGGGGDDDEGSPNTLVPEGTITYNVGNYWWSDTDQDLKITKGEAGSASVWADLQGEYDSSTDLITAEIDKTMLVGSTSLWSNYNSYVDTCWVTVIDEIEMQAGEPPTKGAWRINLNGHSFDKLGFNSIILDVTSTGLDISAYLNDAAVQGMSTSLTWDQLDNIEGQEDPPAYQLFSWACYSVWMLYYEIIFIEGNTITIFDDKFDELASSHSITIGGKVFPPNTGTAGSLGITWIDSSGDGSLGYRDGFECSFVNWWEDNPDDDYDMLFNGGLNFMEYVGGEDSIGFNCIFDGFTLQETYNGKIQTDSTLTLNGGFHLSESW